MCNFTEWAYKQHRKTKHTYKIDDAKIDYVLHLQTVGDVARKFGDIWGELYPDMPSRVMLWACAGHDLIEDTRVSYNDVLKRLEKANTHKDLSPSEKVPQMVADIIYACTNLRGKSRKQRAGRKYYKLIRKTPGAVFVKLCDRIANVVVGCAFGGSMYEKYVEENNEFVKSLGLSTDEITPYDPMLEHLQELLNIKLI